MTAQETDHVDDAVALFNKGQEVHEKGDLDAAIASYKEALKLIPEFPEAEFQLATAYKQQGKNDLAESSFRRAVELREDWSLALAGLGSFLVNRNKLAEAEPYLKKAIDLDEQNFPAMAALAELRIRSNAKPEVLRELRTAVVSLSTKANPPASLWIARGSLERSLGEFAAAKASFRRALELEPANAAALGELAAFAIADSDTTRADEYIRKLESLSPAAPSVKLLRAELLLAEGKNSKADAVLASIADPPDSVRDLRVKIAAASSTDTAALEKLAADDPSNVTAVSRLCILYRRSDPARALEFCRRASELEPKNINHAIGYGAALVQAKDHPAAIALLRRLAEIAPDNSTIRANLATALFHSKRYAEAKAEYRWLVEKQPTLAVAYYFLGIIHDRLGEYLDAAANYQQFVRLADPEANRLEIEKINLRMPTLQKQISDKRGK